MADDLCECVCNHLGATRRLLQMLTRIQEYCTDTTCLDPLTQARENGVPTDAATTTVMLFFLALIAAVILYMTRPASLRQRPQPTRDANASEKPGPSTGGNRDPPGPSVG
eukprot:Opistho-2@21628